MESGCGTRPRGCPARALIQDEKQPQIPRLPAVARMTAVWLGWCYPTLRQRKGEGWGTDDWMYWKHVSYRFYNVPNVQDRHDVRVSSTKLAQILPSASLNGERFIHAENPSNIHQPATDGWPVNRQLLQRVLVLALNEELTVTYSEPPKL